MTAPARFLRTLRVTLAAAAAVSALVSGAEAQLRKGKALRPEQKHCVECHAKESAAYSSRSSKHEPVREGKCETCHLRHGIVGVLRLSAEDPALCLTCHAMEGAPESGKGVSSKQGTARAAGVTHLFTHPPGEGLKCGACHDPHGADHPHLLRQEGSAACLTCHKPESFQGTSAHPLAAVACLTCHDPHGSRLPAHLSREPATLCVSCHDGKSEAEHSGHAGRAPSPATCLSCHAPHASAAKGLMRKRLHAPMAEPGGCDACHVAEGDGAAGFALAIQGVDLCLTCHADPRVPGGATAEAGAAHVHPPVAEGNCLTCHAPHASDETALLKRPQADLCGECHAESEAAKASKAPHPPAAKECTACHLPHAGPAKLMRQPAPALCEGCHPGVKDQVARKVPHPPAAAGECLTCHDPHGSANKGILKEPAATLCLTCHEGMKGELEARVGHPPAKTGDCVSCHEPHGSDAPHLTVADLSKACLACHKDEASAFPEDQRHAPFAAGACLSCHRPHASPRESLLTMEPLLLCRSCHEDVGADTTAASRHMPVLRGQCLSCHGPHGGAPPALIRTADAKTLCLTCHVEEGKLMVRMDYDVHPPFRKDSCLNCHTAHVSQQESLLVRAPAALCGACHDPTKPAMRTAHHGLITAATDCTGCHEPHASEKKKLMLSGQHAPFADGDCSTCHQGSAP